MLEDTRKRGASIFIYVIFGILIAMFVINFGPQSGGSQSGCSGTSANIPLKVGKTDVNMTAWRWAFNFYNMGQGSRIEKTKLALDSLTRRELLLAEAERRGLIVDETMIDRELAHGYVYIGGRRLDARGAFFAKEGETPYFSVKNLKNWVQGFGISFAAFKTQQKREMLAGLVAELLRGSVAVSRDEALAEFLADGNTVTFDVVKFLPALYEQAIVLTPADLERFAASHEAEISAKYKTDERLYKGTKASVKLRQIFIAKAAPAPAPTPAGDGAGSGSGDGSAAPVAPVAPVVEAPDLGKDKLTAARADLVAKKKTFAALAAELSTEAADKAAAGLLGWRPVEAPRLGDTALAEAVKKLAVGDVSEVITTSRGSYLLTVEDKREGDLTYEQVKLELADELARDAWGKEAAKRAALDALAEAKKAGKTLDQLYEQQIKFDFEQILNDPSIPPETKQRMIETLMKNQTGALEWTSQDIPAKGGGSADGSATGSNDGSAAGSAAGGAATATVTTPAAPAALATPIVASTDDLPAFGPVAKPKRSRVGPIPRTRGPLTDVGTSKEVVRALFDELAPGAVADRIYEADGNYVLVQLVTRDLPDEKVFDKDAARRIAQLRDLRGEELVNAWLKDRCDALAKDDKIKPAASLLRQEDEKGNALPPSYRVCEF